MNGLSVHKRLKSYGCRLPADNERGAALIIVLVMLVLLSILGATVLTSSTSELSIAGNFKVAQETFFSADAALEFAQLNDDLTPLASTFATYSSNITVGSSQSKIISRNLGKKPAPAGYSSETAAFGYSVTVTTTGLNNSEAIVESVFLKMRPPTSGSEAIFSE